MLMAGISPSSRGSPEGSALVCLDQSAHYLQRGLARPVYSLHCISSSLASSSSCKFSAMCSINNPTVLSTTYYTMVVVCGGGDMHVHRIGSEPGRQASSHM